MAAATGLRIGDADRDATAAALREHFAQGRLTLEEFEHRLGAVFAAKTDHDLAEVTRDLPHLAAPAAGWPPSAAAASAPGGARRRSGVAAIAGLVMIVLALVVIALILPVALAGSAISRSLLFVLALLLFGRHGVLRRLRRWLPVSRRRWPY